jgi:hypothetical protein
MMGANSMRLTLSRFLFAGAILFATSQFVVALTTVDVENQVKAVMGTGTAAEDAVKSAVASAIAEGMSAEEAAKAATRGAVAAAAAMGQEIHPAIRAAVMGAAGGAMAAGQDMNSALEGACEGAIRAAAAAGADIQISAQAAVCGAMMGAVENNQDGTAAAGGAVRGVLSGSAASGLSPEDTESTVYGAAQGAKAAATAAHQDMDALARAFNGAVSSGAEAHGLPSGAMVAAAKAGMVDTGPCVGCPPRKAAPKPAAMPPTEPDAVEPVPDPTASPV